MAKNIPVSSQNSQKSSFYMPFLGGFSGFWQLVDALQHFFSSLLEATVAFALARPDLNVEFSAYLHDMLAQQKAAQ